MIYILDNTIFAPAIVETLKKRNYEVRLAETAEEAEKLLKDLDNADLILADYYFVSKQLPDYLFMVSRQIRKPVIFTTEEDIDHIFDFILSNHIKLMLNKPVKGQDLANIVSKLLHPNPETWFGLQNYLKDLKHFKSIEITKSTQIRNAIRAMLEYSEEWNFNFEMKFEMDLVWQEVMTNALYHSHGYTSYKEQRIPIQLPDGYKVDVHFGANDTQFGIAVRDYRGTLSPEKIITSIGNAIEQQNLLLKSAQTGEDISDKIADRGRGLDLLRRMAGEYYFIIEKGKSTEVIIIYDTLLEKDDPYSSLRIFELPESAA